MLEVAVMYLTLCMNLRKSVGGSAASVVAGGGLHVRLRANSAPGADDLQGDGGAPFKRISQDIRQNRRNFQRNQHQYPEQRLEVVEHQ